MNFHFGRTWWMSVLTIFVEGLLGILTVNSEVPPESVAAPAIAIAAAAVSHNLGRAYEDGKKNGNQCGPPDQPPISERKAAQ